MASDFRTLMSKPVGEFKPPPTLPPGTYAARQKSYKYDKARYDPQPDVVRFMYSNLVPTEDVNQEELVGIHDLGSRVVSRDFELTEDQLWKLQNYLDSVKAVPEDRKGTVSMHDALETGTNGKLVLIEVTRKAGKTPGEFFNNVGKVIGHPDA